MLQIQLSPFTVLETKNLLLRSFRTNDADDFFVLRSNPEVMKYIGRPLATSIDDTVHLIAVLKKNHEMNTGITWAITHKSADRLIGTIGYWRIIPEHHRAEIGYLLHPDFQGKGMMSEAVSAVLDYGFNTLGLHSVEAVIHPQNTASVHLMEKFGFVQEAHFREDFYFNGEFQDTLVFSLLNKQ
jgi:ribosomal-protein-alanine N-acetyltransferase